MFENDSPLFVDGLIDSREVLLTREAFCVLKQDIFVEPVVGVLPDKLKVVGKLFYGIIDHPEFLGITEDLKLMH